MFVKLLQIIQSYDVFRGPCNCDGISDIRLTSTFSTSTVTKESNGDSSFIIIISLYNVSNWSVDVRESPAR